VTPRAHAVVLGLWLALGLASACSREGEEALPGVRLGMSPRDVRERFTSGEGTWQTSVGAGDDTVLDWTARTSAQGNVSSARFEFHNGMLVAIRARFAEEGGPERVSVSPKTVAIRRPDESGGVSLTVLARDCPTHRDEAARWVVQAGGKP
jgi:hypothetical protein